MTRDRRTSASNTTATSGAWVTATCRRSDGREYEVAVSEVVVTTHTDGSRYVAAYRHWMGLVPYPLGEKATPHTAHSEEPLMPEIPFCG